MPLEQGGKGAAAPAANLQHELRIARFRPGPAARRLDQLLQSAPKVTNALLVGVASRFGGLAVWWLRPHSNAPAAARLQPAAASSPPRRVRRGPKRGRLAVPLRRAGVPPRFGCSLRSHPGAARPGSCPRAVARPSLSPQRSTRRGAAAAVGRSARGRREPRSCSRSRLDASRSLGHDAARRALSLRTT
jgi:hypothetical protein